MDENTNLPISINTQMNSIVSLSETEISKEILASEDFTDSYSNLVALTKYLEDLKKNIDNSIKDCLKDQYFESGEASMEANGMRYTYVPETSRETFNTKDFKAENPELYKKYVKVSPVSESLRTTRINKEQI